MLDGLDLATAEGRAAAAELLDAGGWGHLPLDGPLAASVERLVVLCPGDVRHELACRFAERGLLRWHAAHPTDHRLRDALEAKLDWLRGAATDDALAAALAAVEAAVAAAEGAAQLAARATAVAATLDRDAGREAALTAGELGAELADDAEAERAHQLRLLVAYLMAMGPR